MFGKNRFLSACLMVALVVPLAAGLSSCDRGARMEVAVAGTFADAVASNDAPRRDSMIASWKLKEYFKNPYVANDMLTWFRSFYDYRTHKFLGIATANVDADLAPKLKGALIDTSRIVSTGMVTARSPTPGKQSAFFWLVRQKGQPWRVAMVTKGESDVYFNNTPQP